MEKREKIAVIGAGASGLAAAMTAAEKGACVSLFERKKEPGRKILITGNGKCNIGNRQISHDTVPGCFYADHPERLLELTDRFPVEAQIGFLESLGLWLTERGDGLYPRSMQAGDVLSALLRGAEKAGVSLLCGSMVREIEKGPDGFYLSLSKEEGGEIRREGPFDKCIVSGGGSAAPKTGSDGNAGKMLRKLGIPFRDPLPALCALKSPEVPKLLSGVRARGEITLLGEKGEILAASKGELQFSEGEISGIPAFDVSHMAARTLSENRPVTAVLNLFADHSPEEVREGIKGRISRMPDTRFPVEGREALEEIFAGCFWDRLLSFLIRETGAEKSIYPGRLQVSDAAQDLAARAGDLRFRITGTAGFDRAQVSQGGVPLTEVSENLESLTVPGLYITGELLDVDGICGGYNLYFALLTGRLVLG